MQSTTNYGLNKPESTDFYNVADFNENMDIIDGKLKEAENSTAEAKNNTNTHTSNKNNPHNVTKEQVGLSNVDNTSDTDKPVSVAQQQAIDTVQNSIDEHTENTLNPHKVTAKQVGLENVNNTADIDKPVSTAQQDAIDLAYHNSNLYTDEKIAELINGAPTTLDTLKEISDAMTEHEEVVEALNDAIGKKANETEFNSHITNKSNPHNVTKEQVGLGNVPNVATNDQTPTYTVATANANLTSGEKISTAFGKIAKAISSLISHLANKSNPHAVTKTQVGLGNCDNTSDANKPISTATQTALDGINDRLDVCGTVDLLYSFNGTAETEINVPDMSIYKQLMFGLYINVGNSTTAYRQFIATAIMPRSTFVSGHRGIKMFAGDTSTWGSVRATGSNTALLCNRTSATSEGIEIWGVK